MNTEFFIARRISSRSAADRKNIMVRIATATVAVSLAVMIIALAVISGFREGITERLTGFGGHVQIVHLDGNSSFETTAIPHNPLLEENLRLIPDIEGLHVFAVKGGIIKTDDAIQGIMLKGVGADYDWTFFGEHLVEGTLPTVGDSVRTKDILISLTLSRLLSLNVEDRVEMLFIQEEAAPRRDRFKITGIYETGFDEMDRIMVPTDIRNVQRLNNWAGDQITGYEMNTSDFGRLDNFSGEVFRAAIQTPRAEDESLMVLDIRERFPNLFDWLAAHNVNAAVIIVIMLVVALLNMISALLIILLERTKMIGVLKSLGMSNPALQKMFLIRSSFIVAKGLLWGNLAGISLSLVQYYTHWLKLDQSGYFLSEVPVKLEVGWLLALNAGTFLLLLALLTVPTMIISKINPEKTLRYQ